jgi:protein disulfide-isomerase A6
MSGFNSNVIYLENEDFTPDGKFRHKLGKDVVALIWASWCGYCKSIKPTYQQFANSPVKDKVVVACIQADGNTDGEKELGKRIRTMIPGFQGFPTIVRFDKNGNFKKMYNGDRSLKSLQDFVSMN